MPLADQAIAQEPIPERAMMSRDADGERHGLELFGATQVGIGYHAEDRVRTPRITQPDPRIGQARCPASVLGLFRGDWSNGLSRRTRQSAATVILGMTLDSQSIRCTIPATFLQLILG